jgi:hypothetical protein
VDLLPQPVGEVMIKLRCGTANASRMMNLFWPSGLARVVAPSALKFRLTSKLMEIVVTGSTLRFDLTLPEQDVNEKLRELYELASMVLLVEEAAGSRERMEFSLTREGKVLFQEGLENSPRFAPQLLELAIVIRDA